MRRIWHIIVREYLENVRTKAFLLGIVLTPLWFGVVFFVPALAGEAEGAPRKVVVVDATGVLAADLGLALDAKRTAGGNPQYEVEVRSADEAWDGDPSLVDSLRRDAARGELYAVILTPAVLRKEQEAEDGREAVVIVANTVGARLAGQLIADEVTKLVNQRIMAERNIRPEDAELLAKNAIASLPLDREGKRGSKALVIAPFIFMILLFMGIVGISQMLVSSTIEEKGSRVYEVLLSSVSPFQLMAGKILGICAVGFTLMLLWSGGGLAAANTLKEAQNLMAPLSLLLALPLVLSIAVLKDPNGPFATISSFFPPFTPFMMMARVAGVPGPPTWQIWASLLLLLVSTWLAVRLAARVFRVGILLYGQPPKIGEIWRWMWAR
ncbi:MAG: ABC transporter permease [Planctomycetota bacterium]|jgi:ABC-2 type transport system permease protein